MLLKLLGWFWLITGLIFLLKPMSLRNRLKKQSTKKIRKFIFGIGLVLGLLLINATWGIPGLLSKIVLIIGVIAIIKAVFFLKAEASAKTIEWFLAQPAKFYRYWAVAQITVGALILTV
jgi:uncharacterized membrane protein